MSNLDEEIRAKINAFATELAALVRGAALEAVQGALGAGAPAATRAKTEPRRAKKAAVPPAAAKAAAAKRAAAPKRAVGEKRPPGELAKLIEKLAAYVKAHPGQRMEAISRALGTPTRDLNLPVRKLLAAKRIRVEGQKRATEYFVV
jgi:hypothetical protein